MADYQLTQQGPTVQQAINKALEIQGLLDQETAARQAADALLATKTELQGETARAEAAEALLATISSLQAEIDRATGAEGSLQTLIDAIAAKIPSGASSSNQLADKSFVNSSIATSTATFRGTYSSLSALEAVTADENDYGYVTSTDSAGNTLYSRYKYASGNWVFEYALNNSSFTAAEWAAIQSGITSALVSKLSTLPENSALQEALSSKYVKPSTGIPKADLASGIQTSLNKADSSLQSNAIADNLTTDDATKVLSAKQGVVLAGQVSQLGQKVDDLEEVLSDGTAVQYTGRIIQAVGLDSVPSVVGSNNYTFAGKNLLDSTTRVTGKIKNDSGVETNDSQSNYFSKKIPVIGGCTISASFPLQRLYYYEPDGTWIGRTPARLDMSTRVVPETENGKTIGWVQIQATVNDINNGSMMVNYGETVATYEAYKSNNGTEVYADYTLIYDNVALASLTVTAQRTFIEVQEKLVSGTNIKTINGNSVLGSGNLEISTPTANEISLTGAYIQTDGSLFDVELPEIAVTICGRNLIDESTIVDGKIKNDSGVETNDSSGRYYGTYIPAKGGCILTASRPIQRIYYYTTNKVWIGRAAARNDLYTREVPETVDGQTVGWVQLQFFKPNPDYTNLMVNYGDTAYQYEAYKSNSSELYAGYNLIYASDLSNITITTKSYESVSIPAITIPAVWEPDSVDSGYSSPIGRNNTIRANWTAADKYTYYEFIAHYYDAYIGGRYADGYKVTKRSLRNDCSNLGYEMFEYDFCPANYKKVVLLSAGMNTNETSGIWGVATFIKEVMTSSETAMKFLHDNVRFIILPIICPSSFDQTPLKYQNYSGVRVNKNFNYITSWNDIHTTYPTEPVGAYPDSEAETQNLKRWLNKYSGIADFYVDCHSDDDSIGDNYNTILTQVICSGSTIKAKIDSTFAALVDFYTDKGYIEEGVTVKTQSWIETGMGYPKTLYSEKVCQIPAIMIEQYICSTMYGSDGQTNNDTYGIKNYVAMLRMYVMAALSDSARVLPVGNIAMNGYRVNYK